ncbi:MAG: GNAT family N-acetyltransferase [Pseudomonadota bacterium]
MIKIIAIDEKSPYLDKVIKLGDANNKTLGFLAKGTFHGFAIKKQVLVALDNQNNFLGYLLYGINQKGKFAYIVHLCIETSQRGKGIAKALVNELKKITQDVEGIRVRCRRDYEARKVWPKLGFCAISEMPGRSKHGSTLTIWWFDHGHPTLFTLADEQRIRSKLTVVIDANIFYELQGTPQSANEKESQSLLADWLNVELCLTSEIYNEIDRREDEIERKREKKIADTSFVRLHSPDDEFQKNCEQLRPLFPKNMSTSDESDLRQLAHSIAAQMLFFVTRDKALLKKSDKIYDNFGMHIISPEYLIIHQDELMREAEYQPVQFGQIKIERVHSQQISLLENEFLNLQWKTKAQFKQQLQPYLTEPHTFDVKTVQHAGKLMALVIYGRKNPHELEIPVIRLVPNSLSATLARYLVLSTVSESSSEKRVMTKVTNSGLSNEVMDALAENGFVSVNNHWLKANLPIVETAKALASRLSSLNNDLPQASQYFQKLIEAIEATKPNNILLDIERSLWPAKITDIDIPTFIVPIQSDWAMQLFDYKIASQDLFGGVPSLILNVENVYYRASRPSLSAPARILWYVSKGKGHYQGASAIRACSYLDEIVIDKPKLLYSRFKRLGVYEWKDVLNQAKGNLDQEIMAFRFSKTEVFNHPIHLNELQEFWKKPFGKNFQIQQPTHISNQLFFHLYKMGVKTKNGR